jgi:hypothetical protein
MIFGTRSTLPVLVIGNWVKPDSHSRRAGSQTGPDGTSFLQWDPVPGGGTLRVCQQHPLAHVGGDIGDDVRPDLLDEQSRVLQVLQEPRACCPAFLQAGDDEVGALTADPAPARGPFRPSQVRLVGLAQRTAEEVIDPRVIPNPDGVKHTVEETDEHPHTLSPPVIRELANSARLNENRSVILYVNVNEVQGWLRTPEIKVLRNTHR